MGQCTSNKANANLNVKKILSHKKPKKMDKHKPFKEPKDNKTYPMGYETESNKHLDPNKKPPPKYSKGVAMSFGFKRRPTPMTASNTSVAWECGTTSSDANGNKDEITPASVRPNPTKDRNVHKTTSSQSQPVNITPRPSRFSFPQSNMERTNRVADVKNSLPIQNSPRSARTSPGAELDHALSISFTRTVTIVTARVEESTQTSTAAKDRLEGMHALQTGKFMFQTTRLPQPEPIRVIETKTAKTIANNNRRSARRWRQYEEASLKIGPSNGDSGFSSNTSGGALGENEHVLSNMRCIERSSEDDLMQERLQGSARFSLLENSDSFSDACTPPPLPELPSVFNIGNQFDTNKEKEFKDIRDDYNCRKTFLKSSTPSTFLKTRGRNLLDRDSPQSSSDQEWLNGGEAMADDVSLTLSPKLKSHDKHDQDSKKSRGPKSGAVAEAMLQTLLEPSVSLEMIDSLKDSMNLSLSDEDPNFTAVATNNNTAALLDDEMLSPVESLLSSSETEELMKKKTVRSSSNSKDVNEKLTSSTPGTPSNATYSLSLSDDKDDFLIDDEIADQPELVFEEGINTDHLYGQDPLENDSALINQRRTPYNPDFSPLPLRKRRDEHGSLDSLSPCDSITSEDLMMDYDASQTNDLDIWDRQNGGFSSLEGTQKSKFKIDDATFNNKNFFKSLTPKNSFRNEIPNSPSSLKNRLSRRCSPECRSPKRNHFNPIGFQSVIYDPTSECLTLTRANHSAMQQDIIGIKTMLLTLKRVLNESESHHPLKYCTENSQNNNNKNNTNHSEFRLELADLRRQVIFLQGQLEDKEKTVSNLQKQIDGLGTQNTQNSLDNAPLLPADIHNRCNAATQTERTRPLSTGVFSLTASPIEDNNPILRLMVK